MSLVDRVGQWLRHPRAVLVVLALITLAIGHRAIFVVQDNSPESFFAAEPEARKTFDELVEAFGVDEVLLVELRGAHPDRAEDLRAIAGLARELDGLDRVEDVLSIASIYDDRAHPPALPDERQRAAVRAQLEAVSWYRQLGLARPDVPALGVMAGVSVAGPDSRPALVDSVRALLRPYEQAGYETAIVGLTAAHAAVDQESRATMTLFMPFVVVVIGLVGFLVFRSVRAVLAMILPVGAAVLIGVAVLAIAGRTMNLVSGMMPPLVMAIGFSGATHFVSRYAALSSQGLSPEQAVRQTLRDKVAPTAFAFATTAVGFGSLVASGVPTVQVLGAISAIALLAALVLVTLGTPALLLVLRPTLRVPAHRGILLERAASAALRHRLLVVAAVALLLVPMVLGLRFLRFQMDGMEFLGDDVPARSDFRRLEAEGVGLNPLDLWIRKPWSSRAAMLEDARTLQQLAATLEAEPLVTGTAGFHDMLEPLQLGLAGTTSLEERSMLERSLETQGRWEQLEQRSRAFLEPTQGLRLSLLVRSAEPEQVRALMGRVESEASRLFAPAPVVVSGHYRLLIDTPAKLMDTLVQSLALSVGIIAVLFLVAFRSARLVLGGMFVNLWPVLLVLSLMGWLGIPIDVATVMVGSVAFGIAVDDTFHYLHHLRHSGSILTAAHVAGQGIVATTFMIAAGFAVLGLSAFYPVMRFGLLTSIAVLCALAVDALVLPALVGKRSEREPMGRERPKPEPAAVPS